jgi:hypothetical protein
MKPLLYLLLTASATAQTIQTSTTPTGEFVLPVNAPAFTSPSWRYTAPYIWTVQGLEAPGYTNTTFLQLNPPALWLPGQGELATLRYTATNSIDIRLRWYWAASKTPASSGNGITLTATRTRAGQSSIVATRSTTNRDWVGGEVLTGLIAGDVIAFEFRSSGNGKIGGVQLANGDLVPGGANRLQVTATGNVNAPSGYRLQSAPTVLGPWRDESAFVAGATRFWRGTK